MKKHHVAFVSIAIAALTWLSVAHAEAPASVRNGVNDFDFEFGTWRVRTFYSDGVFPGL
ncbi:MAG: hypothetical protein ABW171_14895 [Steroidobacter sp.]